MNIYDLRASQVFLMNHQVLFPPERPALPFKLFNSKQTLSSLSLTTSSAAS